ncbi:FMN-binding protein [Arachnia rubra]|uniref:FMN-binding protein n=1 Tax=Arachnia rubra TaxID=1547448 RepID=A0ABX7Y411_9ACTN|nr:FMN-binding protein [Arachnia rubra]MBB1571506.1 FMN-binding protein [Propionibacterium sp.]MDO4645333.1 FMN-binding protein [Propionibacteriaceae bacterium]MBB1576338.1 FMN-binding protein [Propionibacterium sp.]QUC07638.1 FMN-binding protein [Arachnia rubra]BCR81943.1 hypothetical protein SK1NUM_23860 [Arachnia rubra]
MKTGSTILTVLAAAGVLGAGYAIGMSGQSPASESSPGSPAGSGGGSATTSSPTSGTVKPGVSGTFTGATTPHEHGSVTVTVTLAEGAITNASATYEAVGDRSRGYAESAIPLLNQEVVQANGAAVDTVSGATYTTEAYLTSLQSALDQARA